MTESKDLLAVLVALHQQAWNIEMERQRVAGEPVSHIKATRAALAALGVAELIDAAEYMLAPCYRGPDQDNLRAAIAACTPAKSEGR